MNIVNKIALSIGGLGAAIWLLRFQLGKLIPPLPDFSEIGKKYKNMPTSEKVEVDNRVIDAMSTVFPPFALLGNAAIMFKRLFSNRPKPKFSKLVDKMIIDTSEKYNVPSNIVAAVIKVESNGDPTITGDNGKARGLMQVQKPALNDVNRYFSTKFNWGSMYMASENIQVGTLFLKLQHKRLGNWRDAIRAYNAGENGAKKGLAFDYLNKVEKWI